MALRGHTVKILILKNKIALRPQNKKVKIKICMLKPLKFLMFIYFFIKHVRSFNPDVMHSHLFYANIICRLYCKINKQRKCIGTIHNNHEYKKIGQILYRLTSDHRNSLTFPSKNCKKIHFRKGIATKKDKVIHNFIYSPNVRPSFSKCKMTYLNLGRFVDGKNQQLVLDAFEQAIKNQPELKITFVGTGPLLEEHKRLTIVKRLLNHVSYLETDDLKKIFRCPSVYINASTEEAFGISVGEALAFGNLVISVPNATLKELFGKRIFFATECTAKALCEAMLYVSKMHQKKIIDQQRKNTEWIKRKFSATQTLDQWEIFYKKFQCLGLLCLYFPIGANIGDLIY